MTQPKRANRPGRRVGANLPSGSRIGVAVLTRRDLREACGHRPQCDKHQ